MVDHITEGEWTRWLESDRDFKGAVLDKLTDHGERLARIEATRINAARAEQAAVSTKKWAVFGGAIATIINGFLLAWGGSSK